jgi:hypothetical protein
MREIHGVADCEKIQTVNEGNYKVTVTDGASLVILNIADATYPAGLTPDRAKYIAALLNQAAIRIENKINEKSKVKA